jgi:LuxR family maltose regulon positive regulatory protein
LLRGDLDSASEWAKPIGDSPTPAELFCWLEAPSITRARVLAAMGTKNSLNQATELLQTIWQRSAAARFTCQMIEVAVLQSLVLEKQGRSEEALDAMNQALALAEPVGWIRPFIELGAPMVNLLQRALAAGVHQDFIRTLLDAAQEHRPRTAASERAPTTVQPLIEPLTNRELDVLELIVQRLQDKEIAERLSVSPQTIKGHLKHIYQKLGVSGRRQAADRGVELGLVKSDY